MQSIDALAEALEAFEGGVVIISHDAQLLSHVCDENSEVLPNMSCSLPASSAMASSVLLTSNSTV